MYNVILIHFSILSLSHTILKLVVPECLKQSTDLVASISRLKAKILSIVS